MAEEYVEASFHELLVTFPHVAQLRWCLCFNTTEFGLITLAANRAFRFSEGNFHTELFFHARIDDATGQCFVAENSQRYFVNKYSLDEFQFANHEKNALRICNQPGHENIIKYFTALVVPITLSDGSKRMHSYYTITEHFLTENAIGFEYCHDLWLRPMNGNEIQHVICQLVHALYYLHREKKIVHMDVAHGNIACSGKQLKCKLMHFDTSELPFEDGIFTCENYAELLQYLREFYRPNPRLKDLSGDTFPPEFENRMYAGLPDRVYHVAKKDIWCLGIFMFSLLTKGDNWFRKSKHGNPVFSYEESEWFQLLKMGGFEAAMRSEFPNLDPFAIDLLRKMLEPNAANRITIEGIMVHPYISVLPTPPSL